MTTPTSPLPPILLVPGYWLGAWAWDAVTHRLTELGYHAEAVTLPGLESADSPRATVRFADHVACVADRVGALGGRVVLVAHSGSGAVACAVADRMPDALARVVYVDSGPVAHGTVPRPDLPAEASELPFPGLDVLATQGASPEGLTDADSARFRALAVPHPAGACREPVLLHDPRRHAVPTTLVCCSMPSSVVILSALVSTLDQPLDLHRRTDGFALLAARSTACETAIACAPMFAPVTDLTDLTLVDLPTGHWPMLSRPYDLADLIATEARRD